MKVGSSFVLIFELLYKTAFYHWSLIKYFLNNYLVSSTHTHTHTYIYIHPTGLRIQDQFLKYCAAVEIKRILKRVNFK